MSFIGIEIGGTKLQLLSGEASLGIRRRRRLTVDPSLGGAGIRDQISDCLPGMLEEAKPSAIGVGFGGPVDWPSGKVNCSHQIEGWSGFELGKWLNGITGLPVSVDNDANTGALGEAICGAGRGFDPVFYITLGSGVGGGLSVGGRIYHGASPGEAEVGHLRLDRSGTIVEDECSGWAVDRRIREAIQLNPTGDLSRLIGRSVGAEARFLGAALKEGDPDARSILNRTAGNLGFALSHVVQLFHPEIIVIGGGLALLGEALRQAVANSVEQHVMKAFAPGPRVVISGLGEDAVPTGALVLAEQIASSSL